MSGVISCILLLLTEYRSYQWIYNKVFQEAFREMKHLSKLTNHYHTWALRLTPCTGVINLLRVNNTLHSEASKVSCLLYFLTRGYVPKLINTSASSSSASDGPAWGCVGRSGVPRGKAITRVLLTIIRVRRLNQSIFMFDRQDSH